MSTPVKLIGFLAAIAAIFGLALVVGRVVGPVDDEPAAAHDTAHDGDQRAAEEGEHAGGHGDESQASSPVQEVPGGLMVSQNGYTLTLAEPRSQAGQDRPVAFTITGPDGAPVTAYDVEHEKDLHLIAVRRDFAGFQHVHPVLDEDSGVWSIDLDLTPGTWRLFADFKATGADALTLGTDLAVDGNYQPAAPPQENRTATVGDYQVTLDGDLTAGKDAKLTLNVTKAGKPVTDLQPYLGAYGHLVALRGGDLAYLHVHPDGEPGDGTTKPGPEVVFYAAVPSAGTYHLYLDFQHDGVVRTAAFTVTARGVMDTESGSDPTDDSTPAEHGDHSGH
ncbi:hypothetical protein DJ010_01535 [Nocardioides silvaticus]|uniref:Heavy metal-binding domain-containing protein n=1 Tax=Nocardioides silvaticus TaxID=2201891 RepID=A0A316TID1_9ACTN|nr:hypothetical protein [Nocardioides silvaticus]PWN04353.1 hypothetical protein DJ010_01535 [Nocardioides silvaticus]